MKIARELALTLLRWVLGGVVLFCTPFCLYRPHPWRHFYGFALLFAVYWFLHERMTEGGAPVAALRNRRRSLTPTSTLGDPR